MAKTILEQVDAAIAEADRVRDETLRALLQPLLVKEFKRVQKKNPKLKRILFGNGTYLLDGVQHLIHRRWSGTGYEYTMVMPKYLERLWELCERIQGLPVEDIE